jgi:hypothetical protein
MHHDHDLEKFRKFVQSQTDVNGEAPSFVGEWAEAFINEKNAEELIMFLIGINGGAFEVFCDLINSAPRTETEWESSYLVGPGVPNSEDKQAEYRTKRKSVVSIVRNTRAFSKYNEKNA